MHRTRCLVWLGDKQWLQRSQSFLSLEVPGSDSGGAATQSSLHTPASQQTTVKRARWAQHLKCLAGGLSVKVVTVT